jgi:hypothetical protein
VTEEEMKRYFVRSDKAWYHEKGSNPTIILSDDMPCEGEIIMEWVTLIKNHFSPHLTVFNDGFAKLERWSDLMDTLSAWNNIDFTQDQFVDILIDLGFEDKTAYMHES